MIQLKVGVNPLGGEPLTTRFSNFSGLSNHAPPPPANTGSIYSKYEGGSPGNISGELTGGFNQQTTTTIEGTISEQKLLMADSATLSGNLTVNDRLVLTQMQEILHLMYHWIDLR